MDYIKQHSDQNSLTYTNYNVKEWQSHVTKSVRGVSDIENNTMQYVYYVPHFVLIVFELTTHKARDSPVGQ